MIKGTVFGVIVKDAEVFTYGKDNYQGVKFRMVSNNSRSYRDENPDPTWVSVTAFRGGKNLAESLTKGRRIAVVGEIEQKQDKDGNNYNIQIVADDFLFGPENTNNRSRSYQADEGFNGGVDDNVFNTYQNPNSLSDDDLVY